MFTILMSQLLMKMWAPLQNKSKPALVSSPPAKSGGCKEHCSWSLKRLTPSVPRTQSSDWVCGQTWQSSRSGCFYRADNKKNVLTVLEKPAAEPQLRVLFSWPLGDTLTTHAGRLTVRRLCGGRTTKERQSKSWLILLIITVKQGRNIYSHRQETVTEDLSRSEQISSK